MKLVNIGYGNMVSSSKIVAVVSADSAPVKRIVQEAKACNMAVDATCGRKCKAVIITESDHVVLSALSPEVIGNRSEEEQRGKSQ